jgi:phosphoribosylanthranilate isomerase
MRTRIKVCCIASIDEAHLAIDLGADALGLVDARLPGPGGIPDSEIGKVTAAVAPPIATFLLTSEVSAEAISDHVNRVRPTTVQIVAHIDPAQSARLAELQPHVRRVQVIHVEGPEALDLISAYSPYVNAFLLDSGKPNAPTPEFGGTGRQHDWAISAEFVRASPRPVFLAGGLSGDNAANAINTVRPFGLDLCSRVRTEGRLDIHKLSRFFSEVRRADQEFIRR